MNKEDFIVEPNETKIFHFTNTASSFCVKRTDEQYALVTKTSDGLDVECIIDFNKVTMTDLLELCRIKLLCDIATATDGGKILSAHDLLHTAGLNRCIASAKDLYGEKKDTEETA